MNSDRFRFRVWHEESKKFYMDIRDELFVGLDGNIYFASVSSRELLFKHEETRKCHYILEQCTGEKDQFGKIVFEGDIVDQYSPMEDCRRRCVVEWVSEAGGGYVCRYLDGKGNPCAHGNSEGTYFDGAYCVVVGNIHDSDTSNQF